MEIALPVILYAMDNEKMKSSKDRVQQYRERRKEGDMRRLEIYVPAKVLEQLDSISRANLKERHEVIAGLIETEFKRLGRKK
jgi:hypothetical protein